MSSFDLPSVVAASLDAPADLYPLLPELFQDLADLGVRAVDVVALLEHADLPERPRVLDLGCGKGTMALAVARRFGASVRGVDGIPEFIAQARAEAVRDGLTAQCSFGVRDAREEALGAADHDVVMMLALGELLGGLSETVKSLMNCVGSRGYVVLDGAYADSADPELDVYDADTTRVVLKAAGAELVHEIETDTDANDAWVRDAASRVAARAQSLAERHPALAGSLIEFAERQLDAAAMSDAEVRGVLWLLRRGS